MFLVLAWWTNAERRIRAYGVMSEEERTLAPELCANCSEIGAHVEEIGAFVAAEAAYVLDRDLGAVSRLKAGLRYAQTAVRKPAAPKGRASWSWDTTKEDKVGRKS